MKEFRDPVGRVTSCPPFVLYPNGVTNTYRYDGMNRLTNLVTQHATHGTLASFTYAVGIAGNRTKLVETVGAASRTNRWQYDSLYRLTNEVIIASEGASGSVGYIYDEVGNRTNRTSTVAGVTNQTFTYSDNDWLTTDGYDDNGNTTNSVKGADTYDHENRLIRRQNPDGTVVEIAYDGDGHRVRKSKITGEVTNTVFQWIRRRDGFRHNPRFSVDESQATQ